MSALEKLARMIGVRVDQADDALACDVRAREAVRLSRRGFFAAGAVMAAAPLVPTRTYSFLFEPPVIELTQMQLLTVGGKLMMGLINEYLMPAILQGPEGSAGNRIFPIDAQPERLARALQPAGKMLRELTRRG